MKLVLILSVLLSSVSSFAAASYNCVADNARFSMTVKPGNKIAYYQQVSSMGTPLYAWKGTFTAGTLAKCAGSCYEGAYSATAIKPGVAIPKTLIHARLDIETNLLNGMHSGKVSVYRNSGKTTYTCNMTMKAI